MCKMRPSIACLGLLFSASCADSDSAVDAGLPGADAGSELSIAFRAFVEATVDPYCDWAIGCGYETDRSACTQQQTAGNQEFLDFYSSCPAMLAFFAQHRAEAQACLEGQVGACGTNDDIDTFCPALVGLEDVDCSSPEPDAGVRDGGGPVLTVAQSVVGAWLVSGRCGDLSIEKGWFICPGRRLRGYTKLNGSDFLDCGTWQAVGTTLTAEVTSTAVLDPTVTGTDVWYFTYSDSAGTLTNQGSCAFVMSRLVGQVTEADCNAGRCSAGGTGPVQCGTDCDCGRCWYCESGTCRYGGEGPYGCYRGCGD